MPSIINGLFSGRSGISSHGTAIAVVSDNISNASTLGYKSSRAEFSDLIAGGQTAGRIVGSGSTISAVSTVFEQGTVEFTSKPLDLAIDGNGFFVLADGEARFYTRAGNFKLDAAGYVTNQTGLAVLGFPGSSATGNLQPLNVNAISQDSVSTSEVAMSGNLDASSPIVPLASLPNTSAAGTVPVNETATFSDLNNLAEFSAVVKTFDSLGTAHTMTFYFFHTAPNQYTVRGYVNSEDVDGTGTSTGYPRSVGPSLNIAFGGDGTRTAPPAAGASDMTLTDIPWNNGANTSTVSVTFSPFTQFSSNSNILSITQDGQGIGAVTSISINDDGKIFARLSNGQSAIIGTLGLANFPNPEGLQRIGGSLLAQSAASGEPIAGTPKSGTFGDVQSGSVELSTVDVANEFVKLITLQRGFQASSRIITTINQLLNDIIQLA